MYCKKVCLVIFTVLVLVSLMTGVVSAGTAASVSMAYVGTSMSARSGQVDLGATVYIYWTGVVASSKGNTVDVTVINPAGNAVANWYNLAPSASGTISFVASSPGNYYIMFDGYPSYHLFTTYVASASVFVLPEGMLGTLITLVAGFSAFGFLGVVKTKREKPRKPNS
jgi:hypothetical protein